MIGLSCNCVTGYRQTSNIGPVTCEACPSLSSVRSDDGLYCLTCLSPLIYTGGTCTGCEDQTSIFVDTIPINRSSTGDRRCQTCPASTIADSSKKLCIPVVSVIAPTASHSLMESASLNHSLLLLLLPFHFILISALPLLYATYNGSLSACQLLINLCVLQSYSMTDQSCQDIRCLSSTSPNLVPEVYYAQFGAQQYLTNIAINTVFSTSCSLDPIALMTDGSSPTLEWHFQRDPDLAKCNIKDGYTLVPIPVLISGYHHNNGVLVNEGDDSSQWQFVRCFYTHQSVTGTPSYLESTEINIQLTSRGHIQSPYLRLSYQAIPTNDAQASFVVRYSGGNNAFNIALLCVCYSSCSLCWLKSKRVYEEEW
uniref:Uncharacterized protein n=1 Tax=Amphimedon queenslandica TaxID=400682 RepID=A0A1X7TXE4_AMPQE